MRSALPVEVCSRLEPGGHVKSLAGSLYVKYNAAIMKTLMSIVCFTVISWATAAAQDGVKVAPENYKVLLENAHVRVVDFTLKPGQKSPMVSRPNRVIYAITPAIGKLTGSDGKTIAMNRKAGEAWWRDAESLAVENTGKAEIHTVVVELKQ
jgi:hypothetical protein